MSTTTQPAKPKRRWYQFSLKTEDAMKRPTMWMLPIALLLVVVGPGFSAEQDKGQGASEVAPPKPDAQIAKWISQLDSERFVVRERATQALIDAGLKSLPASIKATQSSVAEVRQRAYAILFSLSQSDDHRTSKGVLAAAQHDLQSQKPGRVAKAERVLRYSKSRTMRILVSLGARLDKPGTVHLSGARVTDGHVVHLKWLTNLHSLTLQDTKVTDTGLKHLNGLKNVRYLSLQGTKVSDLKQLKKLKTLEHLELGSTDITDVGLQYMKGFTNLKVLVVRNTSVTDKGLRHLSGLTNVTAMDLSFTNITSRGLEHLRGFANLEGLVLRRIKVTDAGLVHLKGLSTLERLYFTDANVTDAELENLNGLTKLRILELNGTKTTDAGLAHLSRLKSLEFLDLRRTKTTDDGVEKLKRALPNCEIRH